MYSSLKKNYNGQEKDSDPMLWVIVVEAAQSRQLGTVPPIDKTPNHLGH